MISIRKSLFLVIISVFPAFISNSRDIRFRKIDMNTGLSHNSVLCLEQDQSNLIWIGTRDGLNRFNGIDYTIFKHSFNDSASISNNQVNCICETGNGDLWIGTAYGLSRYKSDCECFENYLPARDSTGITSEFVRSVVEVSRKELLIGTSSGLNLFKHGENKFQHIYVNENIRDNANNIICLFRDSKDRIWTGTRHGLYQWIDSSFQRVFLNKPVENVSSLFEIREVTEDKEGNLWIGTEEYGLFIIDPDHPEIIMTHKQNGTGNFISDHIRTICLNDNENEAWLGTMDGLMVLDVGRDSISSFQFSTENPDGLSNNSVRDILKDNLGGFWIATYAGGINYYHPNNNSFPHYTRKTGTVNTLSSNIIANFLEEENGDLWIATEGGGLNFWKKKENIYICYSHDEKNKNSIPHNNVKSMTRDLRGNLWIGTFGGLSEFNPKTREFTNFFSDEDDKNTLIHNQVHAVYADTDNQIWIGTNGGGLQVYQPDENKFLTVSGFVKRNVNVILEDKSERLWIGCQDGLGCIDRKTKEAVDISSLFGELPASIQYVQSVFEDHSGRIWIGTQGYGLFMLHRNKVTWFNRNNGLPDNTINSILEDRQDQLWMASNKGLSRITVSEDQEGISRILVRSFSLSQGLQGLQFYPMSALRSRSGLLYFGGINGFNAFSPDQVEYSDFSPKIVLTGIKIRSNSAKASKSEMPLTCPVNETRELNLKYNQRDISISFVGINYMNPDGTFYRYRLKDLDNEWIDLGNQREINFTYLPVGNHELQIKASTSPEYWEDSYRAIMIAVMPPWYMTFYAFLFYFLFIVFLLFVFFRYSQKWAQLKHELSLEHFQREKEEELHQMKLKFYTDVSHELRTPLTLIMAPLERIIQQPELANRLRNQLLSIQRNGQRMIQLINKILDLRKLETGHGKLAVVEDNITEFLNETCLAFAETARIKNIRLEFNTSFQNLRLWFDREKMEIILYNLLSNAMKNTNPGGKVIIRLELCKAAVVPEISGKMKTNGDLAVISVEDNGTGIAKHRLEAVFKRFYTSGVKQDIFQAGSGVGLELTKRLVELHKGIITVESEVSTADTDGFTVFSVYLPAEREYYAESEVDYDFKGSEDPSQYIPGTNNTDIIKDPGINNVSGNSGEEMNSGRKQLLLVIEDNAELRRFIHELFGNQFRVAEAGNGLEGWEIAVKKIPELIISDVMMPEMNGIELCRKVKTDIRTSHIPVVLLTARTAITYRYEGIETGADDYITKPFNAEYLQIRVRNLIRQRELMRNHFVKEAICDPGKISFTSIDEKLLKKAVDYITGRISDKSINVEKLSKEIGLSRVHFYRKIKALTNLTAVEFIRTIRLKRAAALLAGNKITVKEVAAMVGFEDTDYFRKCFKKQFGVNPSDYALESGETLM